VTARQRSKPILVFAIVRRYGHLVQELKIDYWHDSCSTMNIVSSLAHMSLVRKVALPALDLVCERLAKQARANDLPLEFATPVYVASALNRVLHVAEVATLRAGGVREASLFCRAPSVTTLELEATSEDLPFVPRLICNFLSLQTLKISTDAEDDNTFRDAAALSYFGHSSLRRLEICDSTGGQGLCEFVQNLATNLQELDISWGPSTPGEIEPSDIGRLGGFHLPGLRKLEVRGDSKVSALLIRHISPLSFPGLQECAWHITSLDYRAVFPLELVIAAISHLRKQHLEYAVLLKLDVILDFRTQTKILRAALEELGIPIDVEQGGVLIGVQEKRWTGCGLRSLEPADLILTPKGYRLEENWGGEIEQLGHTVSASLDRIRDLKDQAVAVGDRVQVSRIAQALQEGEWLCVERQC
jgi:hypothetical protein